ncbi:hypothetical protein HOC80_02835 [archaeon]|jgi:hypothetical protein|nr:hypothetical protein [archaeon]MBT4417017.1 hypothetical protein [archaeon]
MKAIATGLVGAVLSLSNVCEQPETIEETVEECPRIEGPRVLQVGQIGDYSFVNENCETPFAEEGEIPAGVWLLYTPNFLSPEDKDNNQYTISLGFNEPGSYELTFKGDFTTITIEVEE